jgi:hypothetical protein
VSYLCSLHTQNFCGWWLLSTCACCINKITTGCQEEDSNCCSCRQHNICFWVTHLCYAIQHSHGISDLQRGENVIWKNNRIGISWSAFFIASNNQINAYCVSKLQWGEKVIL